MLKETAHFKDMLMEENMEAISTTMAALIKTQQQTALELTKLVIDHCTEGSLTKEAIFDIYQEASDLVNKQLQEEQEEDI